MSHGISGYQGRINFYRPLEHLAATAPQKQDGAAQSPSSAATKDASLGADLSDAETKMIRNYFPESEQMKLRLYGPNRRAESVNPNAVGQRLDLRG